MKAAAATRGRSPVFACGVMLLAALCQSAAAQDRATGVVRVQVQLPAGAPAANASIAIEDVASGAARNGLTDNDGRYTFDLLPAGDYVLTVRAGALAPYQQSGIHVDPAGGVELLVRLTALKEEITVSGAQPEVETQSSAIATVISEREVQDLPLNGRRFSDLALLAPGVTQDPRSLTSSETGDLAFGGLRGYHTQFFVDGSDNNNAFFAQARGRYRAPYQFSNDTIEEFSISTNSYGAQIGGAGGAVVNVVTKSGSNFYHGSLSYYIRDKAFNARPPFLSFKPNDRQQQMSFTLSGPIKTDRANFFVGFDQHVFHVPSVVEFVDGSTALHPVPTVGVIPGDYEPSDQTLVFAKAAQLDALTGPFPAAQLGNAGFAKVNGSLTPHEQLSARVSTSRYWGANNVFLNPASPIVFSANDNNGEEDVATESASVTLMSALSQRFESDLRLQYSRDYQSSLANSTDVLQKVTGILNGIGRSDLLPRSTNEHRVHLSETVSRSGDRHDFKFGGEVNLVQIRDFFPQQFSGEYIFDPIEVDPFTFVPVPSGGLKLTVLRAYAHGVPRYYSQSFGSAVSHPDTHEYSAYAQDAMRLTRHLALTMGIRYDLQTYRSQGLIGTPLWAQAGKVPLDANNIAPRVGFAYSIGSERPLVIRGGAGIFFTQIPSIYTSAVEIHNGVTDQQVFVRAPQEPELFPQYPNPLVNCPPSAVECMLPAAMAAELAAGGATPTADVFAFAKNFQTPYAEQGSLSLEREVGKGVALEANYLFVHGVHLIRSADANLPAPRTLQYPVFDATGTNLLGFYNVASFANWVFSQTLDCVFPPCIELERPISRLGQIAVFESAGSSVYHGMTLSARKRFHRTLAFQVGYTLAHAIDDVQDAPVASGAPSSVQNPYSTASDRGSSVTDQRHRVVASWIYSPNLFHYDHPRLAAAFDDWKASGIVTFGSGRPVNPYVSGDPNGDGNGLNDRLPGAGRNSLVGPDYATTDLRLARTFRAGDRWRFELRAESFNLFNRDNKMLDVNTNSFSSTAASFVQITQKIKNQFYPGQFRANSLFLHASSAYAPRQVQLSLKATF